MCGRARDEPRRSASGERMSAGREEWCDRWRDGLGSAARSAGLAMADLIGDEFAGLEAAEFTSAARSADVRRVVRPPSCASRILDASITGVHCTRIAWYSAGNSFYFFAGQSWVRVVPWVGRVYAHHPLAAARPRLPKVNRIRHDLLTPAERRRARWNSSREDCSAEDSQPHE